jgi:hypothetical protein
MIVKPDPENPTDRCPAAEGRAPGRSSRPERSARGALADGTLMIVAVFHSPGHDRARRPTAAMVVEATAAAHVSNLDNSAAFTAALLAFLDRTLRPPPATRSQPLPTAHRGHLHRR